jgi:hypothetical protein
MKKIITIFVITILSSCGAPPHLQGKYQDTPFQIETSKSIDDIWSNIIDLFATQGLSIRIIDKSSGLITSDKTSFLLFYSYEDKYGKLYKPDAFIVLNGIKNFLGEYLNPQIVEGEWNVRVKRVENKTIINVNLINIFAKYTSPSDPKTSYNLEAKSTGKFEQKIADIVNK